ncbi:MAG: hypothetical protein HY296_00105 [Thaumarchaeota archaeon]|nr:hypothetical protein [Nitrososphaerota archaeon]
MANILFTLVGLLILWVIISIPVYLSAKAITGGEARFGQAMGATLGGTIVYWIVNFGVTLFLGSVLGASAGIWALILAFIAWLAVYRAAFDTSWIGAVGIAVLAFVLFLILDAALGAVFNVSYPDLFPFPV